MRALGAGSFRSEPGSTWGTPKEVWGFRTRAERGSPRSVASRFLAANAELFGLLPGRDGVAFRRQVRSLGADHLIFQQVHLGRRVHRAYVTVHIDRRGRVYLAKNRAVPVHALPEELDFRLTKEQAVVRARRGLRDRRRRATPLDCEAFWYFERGRLGPAYRVVLSRTRPQEEWLVVVDARSGRVLDRYDNLASARGRARVFDPSPVTVLGGHETLLSERGNPRRPPAATYREVSLANLSGNGRLEGRYVTTAPTKASRRVRRRNLAFDLDAHERGFEEVMAYYHLDRALAYLRGLGYRGSRAIFTEPLGVNVNGTREDNSWYSPWTRQLTFGTGAIDDAEDAETILHEFGHALQDAIVPNYGQSLEAAAMGEGFGDYLAASFFADRKPEAYRACVMTWDGLLLGLDEGLDPPCLRRVDDAWTYGDFYEDETEHENGKIWSATLWDIHVALGRDVADRLVIDSQFQQDGFTNFVRGARAILDADGNLFGGRNLRRLLRIFRARKIGPLP